MTLTQLEYIVALDDYRHFQKAADHCYVTQPTLSMQVKKLEEELGVTLFDRNKSPLRPTAVGQEVLQRARLVLREALDITRMVSDAAQNMSGTLRIGVIPTIAAYLIPLFVVDFTREYPGVDLVIEEMLTHQVTEALQHDKVDVGIVATPLYFPSGSMLPLYYEPFVAYLSPDHPLNSKKMLEGSDIDLNELFLLPDGHCFRHHVLNYCHTGQHNPKTLGLQYTTSSLDALIRMVDQGFGNTLLPYLAAWQLNEDQQERMRFFVDPQPVREISLITARGFVRTRLLHALHQAIVTHLPAGINNLSAKSIIAWQTLEK